MKPIILKFKVPKFDNSLYLDKDGVLNVALIRSGKLSSPRKLDEIYLKKDLSDIENFANKNHYNLIMVSNQPDLSRNLIDLKFLRENINKIKSKLDLSIAIICPHVESENCNCRKPKIGMIHTYRKLFPNKYKKELFIGDQESDYLCSINLGIKFIKVNSSTSNSNFINEDLLKIGNN